MDKTGKKDLNSQGLTGNSSISKTKYIIRLSILGIEQYVGLTNETREQLVSSIMMSFNV